MNNEELLDSLCKEERNKYYRDYYKKNKLKIKQAQKKHWRKKAQKNLDSKKQ